MKAVKKLYSLPTEIRKIILRESINNFYYSTLILNDMIVYYCHVENDFQHILYTFKCYKEYFTYSKKITVL